MRGHGFLQMTKALLYMCAALTLALPGCGEDTSPPQAPIQPTESAFDRVVRENCEAVEAAALAYLAEHGRYAGETSELLPYLPDGRRLVNPATGEATDPLGKYHRDMVPDPATPGSTGYRTILDNSYFSVGFYIVGRAEDCSIVVTDIDDVVPFLVREEVVRENCRIVAQAAEAFAADNGGEYPANNQRINLMGRSIQDYLPGGSLLLNPFEGSRTVPTWGALAASRGEVGYVAIEGDGDGFLGYRITGVGSSSGFEIYRLGKPPRAEDSRYQWAVIPCSQ